MPDQIEKRNTADEPAADMATTEDRRLILKKVARFALVTAPVVTLLLAAQTKPAAAVIS